MGGGSRGKSKDPSRRDLQSHAGRIDDEPERNLLSVVGVTTRLTVAEIMAFIAKTFSPDEVRAVQLYYVDGHGYDAIAVEAGRARARFDRATRSPLITAGRATRARRQPRRPDR